MSKPSPEPSPDLTLEQGGAPAPPPVTVEQMQAMIAQEEASRIQTYAERLSEFIKANADLRCQIMAVPEITADGRIGAKLAIAAIKPS